MRELITMLLMVIAFAAGYQTGCHEHPEVACHDR
jgi:hypothetical protein